MFLEICAVSRISKKEIGRCFKLILKALETSVDLITTGDFMSRFCSNLGLPKQVQMAATHIARKAVELDLVPGRSPISVAAAAIYMASQASAEKRTQKGNLPAFSCCLTWVCHINLSLQNEWELASMQKGVVLYLATASL